MKALLNDVHMNMVEYRLCLPSPVGKKTGLDGDVRRAPGHSTGKVYRSDLQSMIQEYSRGIWKTDPAQVFFPKHFSGSLPTVVCCFF